MHSEVNEVLRAVKLDPSTTPTTNITIFGTDERKDRIRQLANVCIELFLERRNKIAESSIVYAEAA